MVHPMASFTEMLRSSLLLHGYALLSGMQNMGADQPVDMAPQIGRMCTRRQSGMEKFASSLLNECKQWGGKPHESRKNNPRLM